LVQRCLERRRGELAELERDTAPLERVKPPFHRVDYGEAVEILEKKGSATTWGDDLGAEDEALLVADYDRPVFVMNYPKGAKAFYMKENPEDPRTVLCNDCLAPEGYGEIIGGSQRIHDHDLLLKRIEEHGLPVPAFQWYLDIRKYGTVPHAGFGMGIERCVTWITGLPHLREAVPYPRQINRLYP
jgi:asparaginyl-tRNA synthetase